MKISRTHAELREADALKIKGILADPEERRKSVMAVCTSALLSVESHSIRSYGSMLSYFARPVLGGSVRS